VVAQLAASQEGLSSMDLQYQDTAESGSRMND
jgi:hypothetical protein